MKTTDVGAEECLTHARYADDFFLYAQSLPELVYMVGTTCEELLKAGLQLNSTKTKLSWQETPKQYCGWKWENDTIS